MNIVHISPVYLPYRSGMSNVVYEQAKELANRGYQTHVITPCYDDGLLAQESDSGVGIHRIKPLIKSGNGAFIPNINKILSKLIESEHDIVHLHSPFFGGQEVVWWLKFTEKLNAKLFIQYHHDPQLNIKSQLFSLPSKLIFKHLLKQANKIIISSTDYARHSRIRKYIGKPTVEVPLGVNSQKFAPLAKEQTPLFENYEIFKILFVGALDRAHHFKGVDILLQAIARLKRQKESLSGPKELRRLNLHLSIVGSGELVEYYDYLVNHLKIDNNVDFLGFVKDEDLPQVYQSVDALVFPSTGRAEAFGLVALEGMSSGLPVIASRLPGVQTLFADDQLLTKPGDVKDLSAKLEMLFNDKLLRKSIGEKNRQRVLEHYTWQKSVNRLEEEYKNLD